MQNVKWVNQNHPQTLQIGVILLYIDAFFLLIGGGLGSSIGLIGVVVSVGAALGIASNKKLGWYAGIAVSALIPLLMAWAVARWFLGSSGGVSPFSLNFVMNALFPVAQLVALIHPMSRAYGKVFFD